MINQQPQSTSMPFTQSPMHLMPRPIFHPIVVVSPEKKKLISTLERKAK
jgi:hypothetical protein